MTMVRRVLSLTSGRIAVAVLTLIALLAVLGPLLAPQDPSPPATTRSRRRRAPTGSAPTTSAATC